MTAKEINRQWLRLDALVLVFWVGAFYGQWVAEHPKQDPPFWVLVPALIFGVASVCAALDIMARIGRFIWLMQREHADDFAEPK